jgi:hypothetical protein
MFNIIPPTIFEYIISYVICVCVSPSAQLNLNIGKYIAFRITPTKTLTINFIKKPYVFRYNLATNGTGIKHTQLLLKHNSTETTGIYTHAANKSFLEIKDLISWCYKTTVYIQLLCLNEL